MRRQREGQTGKIQADRIQTGKIQNTERRKETKRISFLAVLSVLLCLLLAAGGCKSAEDRTDTQEEMSVESGADTESKTDFDKPEPSASDKNTAGSSDTWELMDGLTENFDPGYSDRDLEGTYEKSEAVQVVLCDDGIQTGGPGVSAEGSTVTISKAGVYLFSGSLANGRIVVDIPDASKEDKVQIVLQNVDICCEDGPAVWIKSADKVFITAAAGTENTLTDGSSYAITEEECEASGSDVPNAAVWSDCDLTINGDGSLTVNGRYNNGIGTKDDLVITGGTLTVTAVHNGLKGKDAVAVCGGRITVTAGGDAVKSDQDNSAEKGWISIDGGTLTLTAGEKGISAQNDIYITDGAVTINSTDDCVHANDSLHIAGGTLELASQAKAIHGDNALLIGGGRITVSSCTEGLEAMTVTINAGEIDITASDDGINASDGSGTDLFGMGAGRMMSDPTASSSAYIEINGGTLYINAEGDGIDSNGTLMVNGGLIYVDGPVSGGDGALDYSGAATITGGTIVAVGSAQMAANFTAAENQCAWLISASSTQKAGSTFTVTDETGAVIVSHTPKKEYQSVVVSCGELVQGGTYTASVDGTELETATLSDPVTGFGGMMGGGGRGDFDGGRPGENPGGFDGGRPGENPGDFDGGRPEENPGDFGGKGQKGGEPGAEMPEGENPEGKAPQGMPDNPS